MNRASILMLIGAVGITGCQNKPSDDSSNEPTTMQIEGSRNSNETEIPETLSISDLYGTYTMGRDCDALVGTVRLSETGIRITETVCRGLSENPGNNSNSVKVNFSNCSAEGTPQPDMSVTLTRTDEGLQYSDSSGTGARLKLCR